MDPANAKYSAFISYAHVDTQAAKWLHSRIEGFSVDRDLVGRRTEIGIVPRSLRPAFRDRDEFTPGHTLDEDTRAALIDSRALVVLCSPAAAKSHWVSEEIRLFRQLFPLRPIVPVIVNGTPGDHQQECFPDALRFVMMPDGGLSTSPVNVLAADMREEGDGPELALAKTIAGLLGLKSDEVFRRSERQRRKRLQWWLAASSILTVIFGALTWFAVTQWRAAERNYLTAEQAVIDLTIIQATLSTESNSHFPDRFWELLDSVKLDHPIFQKVLQEEHSRRDLDCRKANRLELLSNSLGSGKEQQWLLTSLGAAPVSPKNEVQVAAGWRMAANRLRSKHPEEPCPASASDSGFNGSKRKAKS